jgi:hypothetical protein
MCKWLRSDFRETHAYERRPFANRTIFEETFTVLNGSSERFAFKTMISDDAVTQTCSGTLFIISDVLLPRNWSSTKMSRVRKRDNLLLSIRNWRVHSK